MRESRVIALAGVFQACANVHSIANEGRFDSVAVESSLASLFRIDSDSAADAFGGLAGVRFGMEQLIANLDSKDRHIATWRLVIGVLRLERKLAARPQMRRKIGEGIESIQRQVDHLGVAHSTVQTRLAELYSDNLSRLRPRIVGEFEDSALMAVFAARGLGVFPVSRLGSSDVGLMRGLRLLGRCDDAKEEIHAIRSRRGQHHPLVLQVIASARS